MIVLTIRNRLVIINQPFFEQHSSRLHPNARAAVQIVSNFGIYAQDASKLACLYGSRLKRRRKATILSSLWKLSLPQAPADHCKASSSIQDPS